MTALIILSEEIMKKNTYTAALFLIITLYCNRQENNDAEKKHPEKGLNPQEIASQAVGKAKAELGKNLLNAISSKGAAYAVSFCSEKALALTEEMSKQYNVRLKRVSDRPRNQSNLANDEELTVIKNFKTQLEKKEKLTPAFRETETEFIGYFPIETNQMCMQCHGKKDTDIHSSVYENILKNYPEDKAVGYSENQIRGIWTVMIQKKNNEGYR